MQPLLFHQLPARASTILHQRVLTPLLTIRPAFQSCIHPSASCSFHMSSTISATKPSSSTSSTASTAPFVAPPTKRAERPLFNPGLPSFSRPADMLAHMEELLAKHDLIRNYVGVVENMNHDVLTIETPLFPRDALEFYSKFNLRLIDPDKNESERSKYYTPARGGSQGDYRDGIQEKIANVVSALREFPDSKRAVLTIPLSQTGSITADHRNTDEAKCLRELHFYLDPLPGGKRRLSCTGCMRAQAASIFPKNIHFIGTVMELIAKELQVPVGMYTHQVTTLVNER